MIFSQSFLFCHCEDGEIDSLLKDYAQRFAALLREQQLCQQEICNEKRQRLYEMQEKLKEIAAQLDDNSKSKPVEPSVIKRFKQL